MKHFVWAILVLELAALAAFGCSQERSPAPKASVTAAASTRSIPKRVREIDEGLIGESVASAVQSATQTVIREKNGLTGGVASAAQASTQAAARKEN